LCFLFTLAFLNAVGFPIQESDTSSIITQVDTYSGNSLTYTSSEIELWGVPGVAGSQSYPGCQKLSGYLNTDSKGTGSPIHFSSLIIPTPAHLFIEGYLSHIYPSHNFW
jgi:hypothetical protein